MTLISISNIAWDIEEDSAVADLLASLGVFAIDIAPGKYFKEITNTTDSEIRTVRQVWADRGFSIIGMQSLLFGTRGLNVFGSEASQQAMLEHLRHVSRIGAGLNATKLVFGSPKNRDRSGLTDEKAEAVALAFFTRLGDIALQEGVEICLEPNPPCYGANFLTTVKETYLFVRKLAHPAVRMQLDTGALFINREPIDLIPEIKDQIGHIHISEPNLSVLGTEGVNHERVAQALNLVSRAPRTIEMLIKNKDSTMESIARAVKIAQTHYGESK